MEIPLPGHVHDPASTVESKGKFHASHAEAKLMALYLEWRHLYWVPY
jgi:hypothetical protein